MIGDTVEPLPPLFPSRHSPQIAPLAGTDAPILSAHSMILLPLSFSLASVIGEFGAMELWEIKVVSTSSHFLRDRVSACGFSAMILLITALSFLPLNDREKSSKRTVVCVSASRQHVWLLPFGRKCMREDERHVKVPGFWRNINLPIRPEITWPDLTLPVCLSMRKRKREE